MRRLGAQSPSIDSNSVVKGGLAIGRLTEEGFREAQELALQALAIDPDYAQAHAVIGWSNYWLWTFDHDRRDEIWAKARAAAERALELDPATGGAHNILAWVSLQDGDWKGAETRWVRGLALSPGHGFLQSSYGEFLLFTGRIEEARVHILRAIDLDPKVPAHRRSAGLLYLVERNYSAAIEQFEQALAHPAGPARLLLSYTHHLAGDDARAAEVFLEPLPAEAAAALRSAFDKGGYPGMIRARIEFQIQKIDKPWTDDPMGAALPLAIIGEAERMFECLDEMDPSMNWDRTLFINWYPAFDPYRDDPRFIATLNRLLPEL